MSNQTQTPIQKREEFKKRMIAQGKLPQLKENDKGVRRNDAYSPFESWKRYSK